MQVGQKLVWLMALPEYYCPVPSQAWQQLLPAAIGAKLAAPEREVIAVIGDGGFQMNIQELSVVAQENVSVKIIILNNSYLGCLPRRP